MLKGTTINWTLAVVIFVSIATMAILSVYTMTLNSDVGTNVNYAKAAEFANLVKYKLSGPDSLVGYSEMLGTAKDGLGTLGLIQKSGMVKDLLIGSEMRIKGEAGDESHTVYIGISRDFYPVGFESTTIMRDLGTYIVWAYKVNDINMMVDVYPFPPKCAQDAPAGSKMLTCADVLLLVEDRIQEIRDISDLREIIENEGMKLIRLNYHDVLPADFIALKNEKLRPGDQFRFSADPLCGPSKQTLYEGRYSIFPSICFRIVGDYVTPATLQTEISDSDTFYGD